jgi:hypothetical protein
MSIDLNIIPDYVLADAVQQAFGNYNVVKASSGYNFICPLCGASRDNPYEKTAWILTNKDHWHYYCHAGRCNHSQSFVSYLKENNDDLYRKVILHAFDKKSTYTHKKSRAKTKNETVIYGDGRSYFDKGELLPINSGHPLSMDAIALVRKRKIPKFVWDKWFIAIEDDEFSIEKGGKGNVYKNRIIIPYYRYGGTWDYFQARDITGTNKVRYLSAKGNKDIYGSDFLDTTRPFFLLEGVMDACFIDNSVAFGGTNGMRLLYENRPDILKAKKNAIFIWDNDIVDTAGKKMRNDVLAEGFSVLDWSRMPSHNTVKDINDVVLTGKVELTEQGLIPTKYLTSRTIKSKFGIDLRFKMNEVSDKLSRGVM